MAVTNDFGAHFGLKCSSLSKMNRGTSRRSECSSLGHLDYVSVKTGNMLIERTLLFLCFCFELVIYAIIHSVPEYIDTEFIFTPSNHSTSFISDCSFVWLAFSRTTLMCALVTCLGGVWSVEQPSGSILNYYPAWRALVQGVCNTGGPYSVSCLHLSYIPI